MRLECSLLLPLPSSFVASMSTEEHASCKRMPSLLLCSTQHAEKCLLPPLQDTACRRMPSLLLCSMQPAEECLSRHCSTQRAKECLPLQYATWRITPSPPLQHATCRRIPPHAAHNMQQNACLPLCGSLSLAKRTQQKSSQLTCRCLCRVGVRQTPKPANLS